MAFAKGQSGNPKGRPRKIVEDASHSVLLEIFNEAAEREAIKAMIDAVTIDRSVQAFNALMERKYGKVTDKVQSDNTQRIVVEYGTDPFGLTAPASRSSDYDAGIETI